MVGFSLIAGAWTSDPWGPELESESSWFEPIQRSRSSDHENLFSRIFWWFSPWSDHGGWDLGWGDFGSGDLGSGDLGSGDFGSGDLGSGDLGSGDLGSGGHDCDNPSSKPSKKPSLDKKLRSLLDDAKVTPLPKAPATSPKMVELGQKLAFDKLLSGNKNISCMTCHQPGPLGTADDRHLSLGAGGSGLGPTRSGGGVVPRNAPALFNLHAFDTMFWDSRLHMNKKGKLISPAGAELTPKMQAVFDFGLVSAQAMFPVTSHVEMRGDPGTNEIADAPNLSEVWNRLMIRILAVPEYLRLFKEVYPGVATKDFTFAHAANAIAAFEIKAFYMPDSPWESYVAGNDRALTKKEKKGAIAFFEAGCYNCHSGPTFSDFKHYNTGLAQFGPGKGNGASGRDDFGRERVTGRSYDRYRFRTAPLTHVDRTGPYGHTGQYATLTEFIEHYIHPDQSLLEYDIKKRVHRAESHLWSTQVPNQSEVLFGIDPKIDALNLDKTDLKPIVDFIKTLSDPSCDEVEHWVPKTVPSGLPVAD